MALLDGPFFCGQCEEIPPVLGKREACVGVAFASAQFKPLGVCRFVKLILCDTLLKGRSKAKLRSSLGFNLRR